MSYHTYSQMSLALGKEPFESLLRDANTEPRYDRFVLASDMEAAVIDQAISDRTTVPLAAPVPALILFASIEMTKFRLISFRGGVTDNDKEDYEATKNILKGRIPGLPLVFGNGRHIWSTTTTPGKMDLGTMENL